MLTYNNKMVHWFIKMTPNEATKKSNEIDVTSNIQLQASFTGKYPELEIGSSVKVYRKKTVGRKERVSSFSQISFTINNITEKHGQMYYKAEANDRPYLRAELLNV
jgi:hypothetical protein